MLTTPKNGEKKSGFPNEPYVQIKEEDQEDVLNRNIHKDDTIDTPNKLKKFISNEPRTPTPFKNALDEFRKRRGET